MNFWGMGKASDFEPKIVTLDKPIKVAGLSTRTDTKSIFKDVSRILSEYINNKQKYGLPNQKKPWEFISLSKNFADKRKAWDYFTGNVVTDTSGIPSVFKSFQVPAGTYAVFSVRPKHKFLLGFTIGQTKRYIDKQWLKKSAYEFAGYEFEYKNEKMFEENPCYIDLYIAVKEKKI